MPYIHFSEQEKQMANEADIVSYLHSVGESTERHGQEHWWESPSGKGSVFGVVINYPRLRYKTSEAIFASEVICYGVN